MSEIISLILIVIFLILFLAILGGCQIIINRRKDKKVTGEVTKDIITGVFAGISAVYLISIRDLLLSTKPFTPEFWAYLGVGISGLIFLVGTGTTVIMLFSRKR
jgi:hypothetical protein